MRDMKSHYDNRSRAMQPTHEAPSHLYRQFVATAALVARAMARWMRELDYWWQYDNNVYPFEHIVRAVAAPVVGKTPQMLLIEAASRVPARQAA